MLNQGGRAAASTSPKAKWRFDRETQEWVCDEPVAPTPPPAPAVVAWSAPQNTPGISYATAPVLVVQNQVQNQTAALPATPVAKTSWSPRVLLHPDVLLPLVAALIVLVLFLAWAA